MKSPLKTFNSIKVRLKLCSIVNKAIAFNFQFHKGAIETTCFSVPNYIAPTFNSIKVRLKLRKTIVTNKVLQLSIP